jgi:beta-lactam-binding protein with PASTA domain
VLDVCEGDDDQAAHVLAGAHGCRVGRVTKRGGATAKTGAVVDQSQRAGTMLAPGAKVDVTLA